MSQFVAPDPQAKTRGVHIQAFLAGTGGATQAILKKHGLLNIGPAQWYPLQNMLDALRELSEGDFSRTLDLVQLGQRISEHSAWPEEIQTIEDALQAIDVAYHMNHQGEVGSYQATRTGEREITMVCENPYPCDLDYGLIYGIARRFLPVDGNLLVEHDPDGPCRKHGADSCTYFVRW